jgi:DNA-binding response OmpR family regulator
MNTILVVEDDERIAMLVKRSLEEAGYEVMVAFDGGVGKNFLLQKPCDLLVLDLILPTFTGLELCKEAKKIFPALPILMLTALGTTDDKIDGFQAGADDYLVKPFDLRELLVRISALLRRSQTLILSKNNILRYGGIEMDLDQKTVTCNGTDIILTPKEFNLLAYMLENPERMLSKSEISEKVWGIHFDTGTNFIDVYINYLRKKIDKTFNIKLIHTKSGMGFMLRAE